MNDSTMLYYGHRLSFAPSPYSRLPDGRPEMVTCLDTLIGRCAFGRLREGRGDIEPCLKPLQIPLGLAPCAVMCPYCFSITFIDTKNTSTLHSHADAQSTFSSETGRRYFLHGYATYPVSDDQRNLYELVTNQTAGRALLIGIRLDDEMINLLHGKGRDADPSRLLVMGMAYPQDELLSCLPAPSALADYICRVAASAYREHRYQETLGLAQRALVADPSGLHARFLAGLAFSQLGDAQNAVYHLEASLASPDNRIPTLYDTLGQMYLELGRVDDAVDIYEQGIAQYPQDASLHMNLGYAYGEVNRTKDEIEQYLTAIRLDPNLAQPHCNLGVVYFRHHRLEDAERELRAAIRLDPNHAMAHFNLALVYGEKGQPEDEIREYRATVRIVPDYLEAWVNLGIVCQQQGHIDDAEKACRRALQLNPRAAVAHIFLAKVHLAKGHLQDAEREACAALDLGDERAQSVIAEIRQAKASRGRWSLFR